MKKELLPQGRFYKANLHMHTTLSDGALTPEEVKALYKKNGYAIVAFTDHEIMIPHPELTDDSFLALTSVETSLTDHSSGKDNFDYLRCTHLCLYAPHVDTKLNPLFNIDTVWGNALQYVTDEMRTVHYATDYNSVNDAIRTANEAGFLVSYNHPVWSMQDYSDYAGYRGAWAVELWNTGCVIGGWPDTPQPLDDLLRQGENIFPTATDDAHDLPSCCGGWDMICAEELTQEAVCAAMKKGDFYATSGPDIYSIAIDGDTLTVRCSEAAYVTVNTDCRVSKREYATHGRSLRVVEFDLGHYLAHDDGTGYIRVTVTDAAGRSAWSRAYRTSEFKD